VPLQGPFALGAAPAAVVLAGGEHPPQPNLPQGLAAHAQLCAGLGGADPDPVTAGLCRGGWAVLQWAPSPMAGVERRLLDRLGAAGAINFAAIGETRQEGQGSATDAPRLGRCNDHARPLRALSTACQIGEEANYHPFRRTGSGPRHLARTQKGFALRWQARTAKPPIRIACGCCWSAGSPAGLGCINCKACLIWAQD